MSDQYDWRVEKVFSIGIEESSEKDAACTRIYVVEDFPTLGPDWWRFRVDDGNSDPDIGESLKKLDRQFIKCFGQALIVLFDLMEKHSQPNELPLVVRINLCKRPENGYDGAKLLRILTALFENAAQRRQEACVSAS